jgi:Asp-tRNA(Asn)/Glu-tRNA(Gln) amidotransferase A subunit family amidase
MPVGLQIVGPPLGEPEVLALAALIQRRHAIGLPRVTSSSA